ncbi:MAG: permease [Clostridia bacterium]|nr:permease [Clostridia bacterium]
MEFISKLINPGSAAVVLLGAFFITFIGYLLGRISIKGVSLGTAGVFLVALLFGYLFTLPGLQNIPVLSKFFIADASASAMDSYGFIGDIGLVLFVTAVGSIAGPNFFRDLKKNAKTYLPMGAIIIIIGAGVATAFALIPGIGSAFASGVLSGALTSTPAFSAAKEIAGENSAMVSLGQAISYPFGVVGVVLFVQIMPKILRADMAKERALVAAPVKTEEKKTEEKKEKKRFDIDGFGFAAFGLAVVFGLLLGSIKIPLTSAGYEGSCFSLGMTGGPLIMALILAHFGHIGPLNMRVNTQVLKIFREFGLVLFLLGAGVEGGVQLVQQIQNSEYGLMIVLYGFLAGVVITLIPMVVGYVFARKVCKLPLLNTLGSITGGMTSTPALGTLIAVAETDDVAGAYASTYPIALVLVVFACQIIGIIV